MSSATHTPRELASQEPRARQLVNEELELSSREKAILNVILTWSLTRGREWAMFESFEHLGGLAGLDRTHTSTSVTKLQSGGLLHCTRRRGEIRCRFLPSGALVEPPKKVDPVLYADLCDRAARLNTLPDGFDPDGQRVLPLETPEESVDNDLARESRERARSGAGGSVELPPISPTSGDGRDRTESVQNAEVYRIGTEGNVPNRYGHSRVGAGARGQVMNMTMSQSHDSERAGAGDPEALRAGVEHSNSIPWGPLHESLWSDVLDVCEPGMVSLKQEEDWKRRIIRNPRAVREAVLDTHRAKGAHKLTNPDNPGGYLNVLYLDISGERRKAKPWEQKK